MKDVNLKAVFLGDRAQNKENYLRLMNKLMLEHIGWRENYMPGDKPAITLEDQQTQGFKETTEHMEDVLVELSRRMRSGCIPWQSERYWGQMNSETLMPSMIAWNFGLLWNPNNVALESSMATSEMEAEVGQDFAKLFEFKDGWGHLTHDGSMASLEGLWYARNLKSIPLALQEVLPEKVAGKSEWELLNMSVDEILAILADLTPDEIDTVKANSARAGKFIPKLGKLIVPQTKHYSWEKAADILGIGLDNIVDIPVDTQFRMDIDVLEKTIEDLTNKQIPILCVVAVVGTTEEGQVDHTCKVQALREKFAQKGINFYFHVDAAYGGYGRALFLDENGKYVDYDLMNEMFERNNVFHYPVQISKEVYDGFKGITYADSVTIDPHKMGYVPYAVGGIAIRHIAMRNVISYFAPYVFEKSTASVPDLLGAFIIGGSKAGAAAAAVWTAHRVVPLNVSGYGKLVGSTIECAQRFRSFIGDLEFNVKGKTVKVYPLDRPDFNMVDWVLKVEGCTNLAETNELNEKMFALASYEDGDVYLNHFITSHTTFAHTEYGDSPLPFVEGMGFSRDEWDKVQEVTLLRAAIMTPYLNDDEMFLYYANAVKEAMEKKLNQIL